MGSEEKDRIDRINLLLGEYNPMNAVLEGILVLFALFVAIAIGVLVGGFWLIVIILGISAVACILSQNLKITLKSNSIPVGKLAYCVCSEMEALIDIKQGSKHTFSGCHVVGIGMGRHRKLYKQFISYYPYMASRKLRKLACIKIEYKDIYR